MCMACWTGKELERDWWYNIILMLTLYYMCVSYWISWLFCAVSCLCCGNFSLYFLPSVLHHNYSVWASQRTSTLKILFQQQSLKQWCIPVTDTETNTEMIEYSKTETETLKTLKINTVRTYKWSLQKLRENINDLKTTTRMNCTYIRFLFHVLLMYFSFEISVLWLRCLEILVRWK